MKLDTLIDGHQRKCGVRAKVPEHPSVQPSICLELSPYLYSGNMPYFFHDFYIFFFFFG